MIIISFLPHHTATITTQPSDDIVCTGQVAVFTCVVDRNGNGDITSDDVRWEQIRVGGSISTLSSSLTGRVSFNITTTISGDILTSTLTITGVTDNNTVGTSSYRCVVNDMMSRNASLQFSSGNDNLCVYTREPAIHYVLCTLLVIINHKCEFIIEIGICHVFLSQKS